MNERVLELPEVDLVYDVYGPLPTADGRPPLMIGQPMDASGFQTLRSHFSDRTVVTYDPRGLGRSTRKDGRVENTPEVQAADVHALALVAAHPDDVAVLVAHEPPLIPVLPDAQAAKRAQAPPRWPRPRRAS